MTNMMMITIDSTIPESILYAIVFENKDKEKRKYNVQR